MLREIFFSFSFRGNNFISSALTHIDRAELTLSQFWSVHKTRLNYCTVLRHFEQRFKEIQCVFIQLYNELIQFPDITKHLLLSDYCRSDYNNINCKEEIAQTLFQLDDLSQRTQVRISIDVILPYRSYVYKYLDDDQSCYSIGE
jgi:hypothetical protein